jgi:hypothetical protein
LCYFRDTFSSIGKQGLIESGVARRGGGECGSGMEKTIPAIRWPPAKSGFEDCFARRQPVSASPVRAPQSSKGLRPVGRSPSTLPVIAPIDRPADITKET